MGREKKLLLRQFPNFPTALQSAGSHRNAHPIWMNLCKVFKKLCNMCKANNQKRRTKGVNEKLGLTVQCAPFTKNPVNQALG